MRSRHSPSIASIMLGLAIGLAVGSDAHAGLRVAKSEAAVASATVSASATAASLSASPPLPAALLTLLRNSGVPLKNFGVSVRPVDAAAPTMSLNGEAPFLLASTTKVVTALAALNLLGPTHQWRTQAYSTAPVGNGRMTGDLVIVGGSAGLTPGELLRWFKQMRAEGLAQVSGRIVLDRFSLLYEGHPGQAATTAAEAAPGGLPDPLTYNRGAMVVVVQATKGELASVSLQPRPPGVVIVNEMLMGGTSTAVCGARVRWGEAKDGSGGPPPLLVSGRWVTDCGRQEVAFVKLPTAGAPLPAVNTLRPLALAAPRSASAPTPAPAASAAVTAPAPTSVSLPAMVASLWAEAGGQLRGHVVEAPRPEARAAKGRAPAEPPRATRAWSSQIVTSMPEVIREMNKTSNNVAARDLLLSLATPTAPALRGAQGRVGAWLQGQGLAGDDIVIDEGSGQSRNERGRPRAMVQLLVNEWRAKDARVFVDSLPIAGIDGTLANRMRKGAATGRAFMKTGTLSDTRALAGYVTGQSGKVYAVALMVNHPQAARATPALDALVEWLAKNG